MTRIQRLEGKSRPGAVYPTRWGERRRRRDRRRAPDALTKPGDYNFKVLPKVHPTGHGWRTWLHSWAGYQRAWRERRDHAAMKTYGRRQMRRPWNW